jgi:hypothetical protein
MRNLFLALLLANLAFAAWHNWFADQGAPRHRIDRTAPTIELLDEVETARSAANDRASAVASPPDPPPARPACFSLGPFEDDAVADDMASRLESLGLGVDRRSVPGDVWLGHWVFIDAVATRRAAEDMIDRLMAADIDDAYIIDDAESGSFVISLGVFSQAVRAEQRLAAAREIGFAPVVADRTRPGELHWLDLSAADGDFSAVDSLSLPSTVDGLVPRACRAD